ncbi:ESX secretion-associated protein EspG [Actinokineospora iranica]|uniref:EspG family protein n=1 Tax=Actinokineospora iranica TaxID=1271860 RepID=A0A1G6XM16_9PSEU|nr:ESX secretion-associated protein EspG [Actinokineospora iranica]SDD79228.1 EspG family protein [Actinokineospora iranica]
MWSLSTTEFDFLWQTLGLGDYPFPLQVPSFGRTDRERAAIAQRVRDDLRGRGLFHVSAPDPDLERALRVVARADHWLDSVWLTGGAQSPVRVITARCADRTVLLRQESGPSPHTGGDLTLTDIAPQRLVDATLGELPGSTPGQWRPRPVPADTLSTPDSPEPDPDPWDPAPDAPADLRALLRGTHPAGGQIGITLRDSSGRKRRALAARWFDRRDDGRYLAITSPGPDGRLWVTVTPADATALRSHVHRAFGELAAG